MGHKEVEKVFAPLGGLPFILFGIVARAEATLQVQGSNVQWSMEFVNAKIQRFREVLFHPPENGFVQVLFLTALVRMKDGGQNLHDVIEDALEDALDPSFEEDDLKRHIRGLREAASMLGEYEDAFQALMKMLEDIASRMDGGREPEDADRIRKAQKRDLLFIHRVLAP